jgi:hypothetical protein
MDGRDFIATSAGATAGLRLEPRWLRAVAPAPKPLRILFLGGTGFIGPHQVEYAIKRGHQVTLFNRGKTHPGLFPWLDPKGKGWGGSHLKRDRAFAAGLTFRPLDDTIRDTVEWFRTLPGKRQAKMAGELQPEQEAKILAAWHEQP